MIDDDIRRVLTEKADALVRRDAGALEGLLDPAFVYVNTSGRVLDRRGYIETYCISGRVVFLSQQVVELQVTPHSGFALATLFLRNRFRQGERLVEGEYRSLCVFHLKNAQWSWAAGQTTPLPR
jgi:uncharacterized membrane protein